MEFEGCVAVAAGQPTTHDSSHAVKKPKPKIRILHVFPPEIIKTDAANFRELVQRLTGKPVTRASSNRRKTKKKKDEAGCVGLEGEVSPSCKQVGLWRGTQDLGNGGGAKVELEEKDSGGFSWEFGEIESFLQELSDVSLLPSCTSPANNN
ncbi:VQ motif [Musa troglodytarum]|uniref:VQ motif n=1 Tax=Musa troglodytarum TaxID=320322 RepID=A0A9E7HDQ8_9LILI|nr:VQ motif [Musa troglodytarum]